MKRVAYFFLVFFSIIPLTSFTQQTDYSIAEINEINSLKTLFSAKKLDTKKITQNLSSLLTLAQNLQKQLDTELSSARSGDFTENIQEQATKHMQILWDIELQLLDIAFTDYEKTKQEILTIVRTAEINYFKTFFALVWSSSPVKSKITKQKIIKNLGMHQ